MIGSIFSLPEPLHRFIRCFQVYLPNQRIVLIFRDHIPENGYVPARLYGRVLSNPNEARILKRR